MAKPSRTLLDYLAQNSGFLTALEDIASGACKFTLKVRYPNPSRRTQPKAKPQTRQDDPGGDTDALGKLKGSNA